ncbi:MAG: ParB/RepB/Spo0J family partition protein [Chitinophagales bacterium]|nr:ParB/RepB/Spo0J family partition protein [Chitinophagales bacterium]
MSKKKEALGKGIRALLEGIDDELHSKQELSSSAFKSSFYIELDQIEVNPFQPRAQFDEASLKELSDSISIHGVIQPITVRKLDNQKYQLIAGERRLRASKMAGLEKIPAFVKEANDQESLEIALIENIHREDLNPLEIGLTYKRLLDECKLNHEELAIRVGKNRTTVTNFLRLLKLPPDLQVALRSELISMGHAKALLSIEDPILQMQLLKEVVARQLSVRDTEKLCKEAKSKKAPKRVQKQVPLEIKTLQKTLTAHLSTNVDIRHKQSGRGEIVIRYFTTSDLDRLYEIITDGK